MDTVFAHLSCSDLAGSRHMGHISHVVKLIVLSRCLRMHKEQKQWPQASSKGLLKKSLQIGQQRASSRAIILLPSGLSPFHSTSISHTVLFVAPGTLSHSHTSGVQAFLSVLWGASNLKFRKARVGPEHTTRVGTVTPHAHTHPRSAVEEHRASQTTTTKTACLAITPVKE